MHVLWDAFEVYRKLWTVCTVERNSLEYKNMILLIWIWFNSFPKDVCGLYMKPCFLAQQNKTSNTLLLMYETKLVLDLGIHWKKEKASWAEYHNSIIEVGDEVSFGTWNSLEKREDMMSRIP